MAPTAAKRVEGMDDEERSTASPVISVAGWTSCQLGDPLPMRKSPELVPAYTFAGVARSKARDLTNRTDSPEFLAVQVLPPSTDSNTPPAVPAYTWSGAAGSDASALTSPPVGPKGHQPPTDAFPVPESCLAASSALTVWTPTVGKLRVRVCRPPSAAVKSVSAGSTAFGSELLR
jgi:hypothetical protein